MSRAHVVRRRPRPRTSPWAGTIRLGLIFAALIAINVYFFFFRGGTSVGDLVRLSEKKELPALVPAAKSPAKAAPGAASGLASKANDVMAREAEVEVPAEARSARGTTGPTDTLTAVLKREAIPTATANEVVAALSRVFDPRLVQEGQSYVLHFDAEDHLRSLEYRSDPATLFRVEHRAAGPTKRGKREPRGWRAVREVAPIEVRVAEVGGVVDSSGSLYDSSKRIGEGPDLMAQFVDIFAWDINFYVDTRPGDRFKVLVEKEYLGETFYKYGRILAAEYAGKTVGTHRAFWFDPGGGRPAGYYRERGESLVKNLLRAPLKFVRVAPSFDRRRFHPMPHTERGQLGMDYPAPVGTPVWATAPGTVSFKGSRGSSGECVVISHPGGMESIYLHLSQFARGLEVGQSVRQKQVIGYVGKSGDAAAPHLHFSVKMGGHFVDPLRLKPAREAPLPASLRDAYLTAVAPRLESLARVEAKPARRESARASSPL